MGRGKRLNIETGTRFNMLVFIERRESIIDGGVTKSVGLFICDCGVEKEYRILDVKNGHTKSCGCIRKTCNISHGQAIGGKLTKEYITWINMRKRCSNKNLKDYGGRGITVCDRWEESFLNFYEDMGKAPNEAYSLDRIDNNKGYSVENCRWTDRKTQARNTRKNIKIDYLGESLTIGEWSERTGIHPSTIAYRYHNKMSLEDIFYEGKLYYKKTEENDL